MEAMTLIELIPTLGFPVVCVIAMGLFIFWMVKSSREENAKSMEQVQARCAAREEKLYEEIAENRKINGQFAEVIAKYDAKLEDIKNDVKEIKEDVIYLKAQNN